MNRIVSLMAAMMVLALSVSASAQVLVDGAWVRSTVQHQRATGAFMTVTSTVETSLVGVASPIAGVVEIHESSMDGGVMKMRAIPRIPLAPNKPVELKPGGYHVMLMSLTRPVNVGQAVPLTLTFEDKAGRRTTVEVQATVRPLGGVAAKHAH